MSALLSPSTDPRADVLGPLAARAGVTAGEAMAVKRHAARTEAGGDARAALDAWRLAIKLTPGDARAWDGVARCLQALGETTQSRAVAQAADVLRRKS